MQRLASRTLDDTEIRGDVAQAVQRLRDAHAEPAPSVWLKYRRMAALVEQLADELGAPDSDIEVQAPYVQLPPVVTQFLLRAHLFNERLYRA